MGWLWFCPVHVEPKEGRAGWPLFALAGLVPLAIYSKKIEPSRKMAQFFASFTDQQLFKSVEILAMCGFPEWEALISRADRPEVVACARQFLAT
jgi:hypothetical protein